MRIVAGLYKSRKLIAPPGEDIRPTSDKVRGAIFNALTSRGAVEGARVLDAFCGTGALGLEALSRGAVNALFLDKSRASLDCARANARALGADQACGFLQKDALKIGPLPADENPFSLVFLDPPYRQNMVDAALKALLENGWLGARALIVAECESAAKPVWPNGVSIQDEKSYGDTKVVFLEHIKAS